MTGTLPPGTGQAHFLLNGRPVGGMERKGLTFTGAFLPPSGFNEFEVRFGRVRGRISFIYAVKASDQAAYSYHQPLLEGECDSCHGTEPRGPKDPESDACYRCHPARETLYPYVHGPVGAGKCLVCHDPHGSNLPSLTLDKPAEMCTSCHSKTPIASHVAGRRSRVCTFCHDPHYGLRRYFLRADVE